MKAPAGHPGQGRYQAVEQMRMMLGKKGGSEVQDVRMRSPGGFPGGNRLRRAAVGDPHSRGPKETTTGVLGMRKTRAQGARKTARWRAEKKGRRCRPHGTA